MPKLPPPPGHQTITPGFMVPGANAVLEWMKRAPFREGEIKQTITTGTYRPLAPETLRSIGIEP